MELVCKTVYKIDYNAEEIAEIIPDENFDNYAFEIIENINNNIVTKEYAPTSQATQVVSDVRNTITIMGEEPDFVSMFGRVKTYMVDIANRLLAKEMDKQDQIYHMGQNVKKGSLIQAIIKEEEKYSYLLAKVEHSTFIDDADFSFKTGFSSEQKKIWKTCIMECEVNDNSVIIQTARIYLNNAAKYWADDFLELREVSTDGENTKKAFRSIDTLLNREVKTKAPSDYTIIRNYFVGYMKREQQLNYNDMVEDILGGFTPEQMSLDEIGTLKTKMLELPETKHFERLFMVVPKEVKARVRKIYSVNDGIEVKVDGFVENIKETISAVEDVDTGAKYIKIMTNNDDK